MTNEQMKVRGIERDILGNSDTFDLTGQALLRVFLSIVIEPR